MHHRCFLLAHHLGANRGDISKQRIQGHSRIFSLYHLSANLGMTSSKGFIGSSRYFVDTIFLPFSPIIIQLGARCMLAGMTQVHLNGISRWHLLPSERHFSRTLYTVMVCRQPLCILWGGSHAKECPENYFEPPTCHSQTFRLMVGLWPKIFSTSSSIMVRTVDSC